MKGILAAASISLSCSSVGCCPAFIVIVVMTIIAPAFCFCCDTGIFDLGFAFKPAALPGLSLQFGATATAGMRHGVGGNFMVKYEF